MAILGHFWVIFGHLLEDTTLDYRDIPQKGGPKRVKKWSFLDPFFDTLFWGIIHYTTVE